MYDLLIKYDIYLDVQSCKPWKKFQSVFKKKKSKTIILYKAKNSPLVYIGIHIFIDVSYKD